MLLLAGRIVLVLHPMPPAPAREVEGLGLTGDSAAMAQVRADVRRVADLEVAVLLRGETGTGKELVARAIHRRSPRRSRPYLAVNMGAIPPALAAAELFGAARGAFTGADQRRTGYFSQAHGGTLFLDEIGETPPEVQVLLLRALETGEIQPVGAEAPRRVDVRVLAATDADLEAAIAAGRFRAPLLHRLNGYEIRLPALARTAGGLRSALLLLPPPGAGGHGRKTGGWTIRGRAAIRGCRRRSSPGWPRRTGRVTCASSATWRARSPSATAARSRRLCRRL